MKPTTDSKDDEAIGGGCAALVSIWFVLFAVAVGGVILWLLF